MNLNDPEGKCLFANFLINKGFYNIQTTTPFCRWDIEAEYKKQKYYFELKSRTVPSTAYNDAIIQEDKYEALKDIPNCYVVNIYTDNLIAVIPVNAEHVEQHHLCQKTNNWDRTRVPKTLISYPLKPEYLHSILFNERQDSTRDIHQPNN